LNIELKHDCIGVNWDEVYILRDRAGLGKFTVEQLRKAFENSNVTVFAFDAERLVGIGRALTDGACQAALYDLAVLPEFQGKGIGTTILSSILEHVPNCNVILYANPGKEAFYEKFTFRKLVTGMALFTHADIMKEKGIIE
jgi:GNAT superfamily N-acetyltransferase